MNSFLVLFLLAAPFAVLAAAIALLVVVIGRGTR
jgi:hypothetical protein